MKETVKNEVNEAKQQAPVKEKVESGKLPQTPQVPHIKETKYCTLLESCTMLDSDGLGYTYAFEKIYVKELDREEIRICLYKDMRNRGGKISKRLLIRPCDLTEIEFIQLFEKAIKEKLFSDEFLTYLRNIVNQK